MHQTENHRKNFENITSKFQKNQRSKRLARISFVSLKYGGKILGNIAYFLGKKKKTQMVHRVTYIIMYSLVITSLIISF